MDITSILTGPAPVFPKHKAPLTHSEIQFPHIIDNSMLSQFKRCERRHYWSSLRKAQPLEDSVHLVAGGAYAKGLEVTRREYFDNGRDFKTALMLGTRAALIAYGNFQPFGRGSQKTVWRIMGAMEYHFSVWPIDQSLKPYKSSASGKHTIEYSFAIPIGLDHPVTGEPLLYCGRFDFLGYDNTSGAIGPVDDKTTTQLGDYWQDQWDMSGQMHGYGWACKQDGIDVTAAFIRGVAILKSRYNNADQQVLLAPWRINQWHENTLLIIERAIRAYKAGKWAMDYSDACNSFGGCPYKHLCLSPAPDAFVPVDFRLNEWDPLASRD